MLVLMEAKAGESSFEFGSDVRAPNPAPHAFEGLHKTRPPSLLPVILAVSAVDRDMGALVPMAPRHGQLDVWEWTMLAKISGRITVYRGRNNLVDGQVRIVSIV